jgi:NAD(P)-dependent dehydrogenase (short-subunit alcohol dehydrogenase family)
MTPILNTEFSLSLGDSLSFAQLSGDYNPLHVDPIAARRLRFGSTVTHGIHLFLRALDELAGRGLFDRQEPTALTATFDNAVLTGSTVSLSASTDGRKIRFSAQSAGRPAFTGTVELDSAFGLESAIEDVGFAPACPEPVEFPPTVTEGDVPLKLSTPLVLSLFPSLAKLADARWIADLLSTTQIVGMRCPGMHSIYSGFKVRREARTGAVPTTMHYRVSGAEKRFQLLRLQVNGGYFAGTVEAFFRPRPVTQRSMKEIAAVVSPEAFAGQDALIVGGSRGLGELTAKIMAAGGANVTITYSRGKEDAENICAEARALGRTCAAYPLDSVSAATQAPPEWLANSRYSHVYFFASPLIAKNVGRWDEALFRQFTQMYVTAFAALVEQVLASRADRSRLVNFVYPSSIFVTQPEAGFAEYAVAKAAGEALCDQLQRRSGVRFSKPRLPRMRTDQTSALVDIGAVDPFPVMLDVVRSLHS